MISITIDYENSGNEFWGHLETLPAAKCPPEIRLFVLGSVSQAPVTEQRGNLLKSWCEQQPGWSNGPAFARHPLVFDQAERFFRHRKYAAE